MEVGESWAYRARGVDPLVEVVVERLGTQKPPRVYVRFVDDAFEGRREWVSPARLKVPWSEVGEYVARAERWRRVRAVEISGLAARATDTPMPAVGLRPGMRGLRRALCIALAKEHV